MSLDKALAERIMEKILDYLKADELLAKEIREFRLSEPTKLIEFPLLYVEFSPTVGEYFIVKGANSYERRLRFNICVVDRHVEPEKADIHVFRLADYICRKLASDPTLGGVVEDSTIERVIPEYGLLGDHAISQAKITLVCRVMWRA